ncbi:MAG: hypothetical protein MUF14_07410 [Hyphomonadaceae bacterium]|nr:hypothetical protein [Hyphomonadaceae bacterium]
MFYQFPAKTYATARQAYERPYETAIMARAGETVVPKTDNPPETDFMGWTWCRAADGREGWVPDAWCEVETGGWRLRRDFDAMELSVSAGERLRLIHSESGFVFVETAGGVTGWLPDAVLERAD